MFSSPRCGFDRKEKELQNRERGREKEEGRKEETSLTLALLPSQIKNDSWGVGQAWGYRRRAFASMARALGGPGAKTLAEVMGKEPEGASRDYEWPGWPAEEE